jgi:hypothetical protein
MNDFTVLGVGSQGICEGNKNFVDRGEGGSKIVLLHFMTWEGGRGEVEKSQKVLHII